MILCKLLQDSESMSIMALLWSTDQMFTGHNHLSYKYYAFCYPLLIYLPSSLALLPARKFSYLLTIAVSKLSTQFLLLHCLQ